VSASPSTPLASERLSDEEFEGLTEFLDAHSPFDYDGLLGLLHAIAVAPGLVPASTWLPVVSPDGLGGTDSESVKASGWLLRQYGEIVDALKTEEAILPDRDDVEACQAFAAGYAAGAELDPEWTGDDDRWTFATGMAYLGGRLDLLTEFEIQDIESDLAPDPKQLLSEHLSATIRATYEAFSETRAQATGRATRDEPH
jgi:hypothetical protein